MARKSHERSIRPSLLDRLIDEEPGNRGEAPDRRAQSLKELKDSVRRDLEWLLNSRRPPVEPAQSRRFPVLFLRTCFRPGATPARRERPATSHNWSMLA